MNKIKVEKIEKKASVLVEMSDVKGTIKEELEKIKEKSAYTVESTALLNGKNHLRLDIYLKQNLGGIEGSLTGICRVLNREKNKPLILGMEGSLYFVDGVTSDTFTRIVLNNIKRSK